MRWTTSPSRWTRPAGSEHAGGRASRRCFSNSSARREVGDAGLVLDGDEHDALGASPASGAPARGRRSSASCRPAPRIASAQVTMPLALQDPRAGRRRDASRSVRPICAVVLDDLAARPSSAAAPRPARRPPARRGFPRAAAAANSGSGSSRSALIAQSASRRARPERWPKASASASRTSAATARPPGARDPRSREGLVGAGGDDRGGIRVGEAAHHAQAEPHGEAVARPIGSSVQSQREALTQTGRTSTPCCLRVADDLRRRVEAHRLGVEEGARRTRPDGGTSSRTRRRRSARTRPHGFPGSRSSRSPRAA